MGPIIRAGCNSRCPNSGAGCDGCRGPIDEPNINAEKDLLAEYGLTVEDIMQQFSLYNTYKGKEIKQKIM